METPLIEVNTMIWWLLCLVLGIYIANRNKNQESQRIGAAGEREALAYVHHLMHRYNIKEYHVLNNVILEYAPNRTTEIDLICLTRKGVYVIEMKNYKGKITGKQEDHQWIQKVGYKEPRFFPFYNPVRQNQTHIRTLERYIKAPIYSWILFGEQATLNVQYEQSLDLQIHTIADGTDWFHSYTQLPYIMSVEQLNELKDKIDVTIRSKQSLKAHIRRLQFKK